MKKERLEGFLNELGRLTNIYGIEIEACGCDGGPYLTDVELGNRVAEYLVLDNGKYKVSLPRTGNQGVNQWNE